MPTCCRREKRDHCITSALFCRHAFFCHFKSSKLSKKKQKKKNGEKSPYPSKYVLTTYFKEL